MCGSLNTGSGGFNGLQIMSAVADSMASAQQQRMAAQQNATQIEIGKRQKDDEYRARLRNAVLEMQEAELAQRQANDSATQSKFEIAREMLRAREEAKASASAAGIAGNVVNRLLTDISVTEQQKRAIVDTNRDNIVITQQLQKHKAKESTKVTPFYYTESSGGNFFNSMLGIVPALFSGFNFSASSCSTPTRTASTCRR